MLLSLYTVNVCMNNVLRNLYYQVFYCIKAQDRKITDIFYVKILRSVVFVIATVSFLLSCLSLEAET
jgi:hypothetical protein